MAKRSTLLVLALYAVVSGVLLAGALRHFERIGGKDWNAFLGQAQAECTSLLDYGEFPAWNPWRRGGQVSFAQPESMLLSPVTPLALVVGANAAFKLLLVPLFLVAAMGMWTLAGDLGLAGLARALTGAVFIGASVFPLYVNGGLPNWLCGMAILPWLVVASRRAVASGGWLAAGAALYAALLFCGNVHHFLFFPLLLALEAVARAIQTRRTAPIVATATMGIVGAALSLVRLVPLLELFSEFPRRLDASGRFLPLGQVARSLLLPHPPDLDGARRVFFADGSALYWIDCGAYVGPVVLLLALAGVALALRRAWPALLIGGCFLWLALGSGVSVSLWDLLRRLPIYASMQAPERFMGFVLFALALLAGFGGERLLAAASRLGGRARPVAGALLLLAVVVPLLVVNASISGGAFPVEPPEIPPTTLTERAPPRPPFLQSRLPGEPLQWGGPLYPGVLRNVGNVDGQSDIPSPRAALAADDPGYRGEVYLEGGHGEITGTLTPNRLRLHARVDAPDRLVVNQNFFPGWKAAGAVGGDCVAHDGRIALPLAPGDHDLELRFAPATIPFGAAASLVSLLLLAIPKWRQRRLATVAHALLLAGAIGWYEKRTPSGIGAPPKPWREVAFAVRPQAGEPSSLERALESAAPGSRPILRLLPGDHGAARVKRGATLVADPAGAASLTLLTIADLPAGEQVVLVGLAPAKLRVERCAGAVIVAAPRGALALDAEASAPIFVFGAGDGGVQAGDATTIERATLRDSRVAFARCAFAPPRESAAALDAEGSVVLLNACRFEESDPAAPPLALRRQSIARLSATPTPTRRDVDASSQLYDPDDRLDEGNPRLRLDRAPSEGGGASVTIHGPAGARGTLIEAHAPALVPYRGEIAGQFLECALDGRESLLPFELDAQGSLTIRIPVAGDDWRPGDGLYLQAFFSEAGDDPRKRRLSLLDGGPLLPKAE